MRRTPQVRRISLGVRGSNTHIPHSALRTPQCAAPLAIGVDITYNELRSFSLGGWPMKQPVPAGVIHRLLAPGPVVLVTAGWRGRTDLTTAAWVTALSGDPSLVGLALRPQAVCHELIRRSEEFILNVPPADLARQVQYCGTVSGADADKWAVTGLHPAGARQVAAPWVEECLAHLECGLVQIVPVGDHDLFIGQV